jgi:single-strand DNA-binding protein
MLNHITIHGRLTADPELKQTQSGVSVCNITVAVDRSYKNGEEKQTDFFTVICWRNLAEMVGKYFKKGKEILVSGEMQSRKWKDKDGNNRISWELMANGVDFCGSKSDSNGSDLAPASPSVQPKMEEIDPDDDLPF